MDLDATFVAKRTESGRLFRHQRVLERAALRGVPGAGFPGPFGTTSESRSFLSVAIVGGCRRMVSCFCRKLRHRFGRVDSTPCFRDAPARGPHSPSVPTDFGRACGKLLNACRAVSESKGKSFQPAGVPRRDGAQVFGWDVAPRWVRRKVVQREGSRVVRMSRAAWSPRVVDSVRLSKTRRMRAAAWSVSGSAQWFPAS